MEENGKKWEAESTVGCRDLTPSLRAAPYNVLTRHRFYRFYPGHTRPGDRLYLKKDAGGGAKFFKNTPSVGAILKETGDSFQ
jgi:hypothetical protein